MMRILELPIAGKLNPTESPNAIESETMQNDKQSSPNLAPLLSACGNDSSTKQPLKNRFDSSKILEKQFN